MFDDAESAIVSADGAYVFVGNAAEIGDRAENFGWTEGEGYGSKLAVTESSRLEMVAELLINGLTAPLGMAVLNVATDKFATGTVDMGSGSAFHEMNRGPVAFTNALAIDDPGNLYVVDMEFGGAQFHPSFEGRGGIWKIPNESLDAYADGTEVPTFTAIAGNADGVEVSPLDGKIYVNIVGAVGGACG